VSPFVGRPKYLSLHTSTGQSYSPTLHACPEAEIRIRQLTGRRLNARDADAIIAGFRQLDRDGTVEFMDAKMEELSVVEQVPTPLHPEFSLAYILRAFTVLPRNADGCKL